MIFLSPIIQFPFPFLHIKLFQHLELLYSHSYPVDLVVNASPHVFSLERTIFYQVLCSESKYLAEIATWMVSFGKLYLEIS